MGTAAFDWWTFEPELTEGSEIQCPECAVWSPAVNWREGDVPCDDCGDHPAIFCPECYESFDHIRPPTFRTRPAG